MRYYELTCLISPDLTEQELGSVSEKINSLLQEQGAVLDKILEEKKVRLGYSIQDKNSAFLKILSFSLNPEKLIDLEKNLKEKKEILRYFILVKKEPLKQVVFKRRVKKPEAPEPAVPEITEDKPKKKVELKDIDQKLKEILEE